MKKSMIFAALAFAFTASFVPAQTAALAANEKVEAQVGTAKVSDSKLPKIYVVGDSTAATFADPYFYPRFGIGTKIQNYIDESKAEVVNIALSGRSSKSYLSEQYYTLLKDNLKKGDYLFLYFGHNDEKTEEARFTDPNGEISDEGSFKNSLYENYLKLAKERKATAVLFTPIVRRSPGKAYEGAVVHVTQDVGSFKGGDYPQAIRTLGKETKTLVIDNTSYTKELYEKVGDSESVKFHAWLTQKDESVDNTHLNTYGASVVAFYDVNAVAKSNKKFAKLLKKDVSAPEISILTQNPNFIISSYSSPSEEEMSAAWNVNSPWYGTVFGDCGGGEKIFNTDMYEIIQNGSNVSMHSGTKDGSSSVGKISSKTDGIAFFYQRIPANKDFEIKTIATVRNVSKNNQVSFGIMVRDDIYLNKFDNSIHSNYVSCGVLNITKPDWFTSFSRSDINLSGASSSGSSAPAANQKIPLTVSKKGTTVTVQYGSEAPVSYTVNLTDVDSDYVYAGLYTARSAYIDFSDVSLIIK